jgi:hypothetical protein
MILLGGKKVAYIDVLVQEESGGGGFVWKPTRTDLITARSAHGVVSLPGTDTLLELLLYLYHYFTYTNAHGVVSLPGTDTSRLTSHRRRRRRRRRRRCYAAACRSLRRHVSNMCVYRDMYSCGWMDGWMDR